MFRSKRTPEPTIFLEMDQAKSEARRRGLRVIDLSIGTSDLPPPHEALEALKTAVDDPSTYGYCLKSGTRPFLEAATAWYARRYGLELDPGREALALIGSQEGLAHLLLAVADPGDGLLLPEVAYPSYFGAAKVAGLEPHLIPLGPDFLPVLEAIPEEVARKSKVLLLNYPNNPTSALADEAWWRDTLSFAERYGLLLVHDNPYVDQVYAGQAPSPLALPGGKERVVELFSFSKSYHLTGFRLGFALGNAEALGALEAVKGPVDFNQYAGIQRMGIACLGLPEERVRRDAGVWQRRARALVEALGEVGWKVPEPKACMYLWTQLPQGLDDLEFCKDLVAKTGVALAPGRGFGPGGYGYVRFALVQPEPVLREAIRLINEFLRAGA
ncbi:MULTISPECIES: aminotransferase class I/II-fold pyridoxal phosphate-dependent enzyme [unclassified Meiothermus]|uniref:aminotransferase class I/II-fold pyridoxal phosphate-dependent enzyme n=1 Tax=unclassified Meiothermus TaxID=370471 RepID=UPI000D7CDFD7|nr:MULTISPECIES: aminotransferase class I/II-fold pyridoxal phosphate-dependent enzyme [unclassified Meiothermus]PZA05870.1 succinyldiaminopimelate aminotransferase [Meiothermus sp. Pnk-1]RYM30734.1 aminotransferase class I/II-fold pyridoxal phosphate-dependent enzyme [Meiothermus sp. PNK-Is4]